MFDPSAGVGASFLSTKLLGDTEQNVVWQTEIVKCFQVRLLLYIHILFGEIWKNWRKRDIQEFYK